jgi:diguanylate cyclase (GGDEF)-like protein
VTPLRSLRWRSSSWLSTAFAVVATVAVVVAGAVGLSTVQAQIETRTLQSTVLSSRLISSLVVHRNISKDDIMRGTVGARGTAAMDSDVVALRRDGGLVGLEVWTIDDGHLMYADQAHPENEPTMPADELARARRGAFTQFSPEIREVSTLDVFLPYDADNDGAPDVVVEVLLPRDPINDAIARSTRLLYAGAGLVPVFAALVFWAVRRRRRSIQHAARHDRLTGLGNWSQLAERAEEALGGRSSDDRVALLVLDLNGFREVNDTLGHQAGDDLLVAVAGRLRLACRRTDTVIRIGGDKFAVLMPGLRTPGTAVTIAHQLRAVLRRPVTVAGLTVEVDASIGAALGPDHGTDLTSLLRSADVAMYDAKRAGSGVAAYDPRTDPREAQQLTLLGELRRAIGDGQLRLHYQPQCRADGRIEQVEALIRWQHPDRGLLPPDAFIPLAERTTLIKPLTTWVLGEAARQCAAWRAAGHQLRVAVNISPRNLIDDDLPEAVSHAAAATGLPVSAIEVEITETAVMLDPDRAAQTLTRLSGMGVSVAIDDFGVGYTSLSHLATLPVSSLKIDRRFICNLLTDESDHAIVRNVIQLAHDLGMVSLAEGVETVEVWSRLTDLGCDEIQGYLLTPPLPPDQVTDWITTWHSTPTLPAATHDAPPHRRRPAEGTAVSTAPRPSSVIAVLPSGAGAN